MERIRNIHKVTRRLIVMTSISVVIFGAIFALTFYFSQRLMMTWAGFLCGIIGGFVSIQQRVKSISDEELRLLTHSWFQILLVPVFGGIFALVLYCLFLSGIVSGSLFPSFYIPPPPLSHAPDTNFMVKILSTTYPSSGQDLAKFLFWSFVAGFSERFVPQIISNVTNKATEEKNSDENKAEKDQ